MEDIKVQVYSQPEKTKNKFSLPKIIFIVLGIIVLAEVIFAVKVLLTPAPSPAPTLPAEENVQTVAKISLTAAKTNFKVGETVPVSVVLDTGGQTVSGADLIVNFDPKLFEVSQKDLVKGEVFEEYPSLSADSKLGLISISGITTAKNGFTGFGQFAFFNLKAKMAGSTSLTINFTAGSTTDSNLVDVNTAKNILEQVDNLEINIQ